MLFNHLLIRKKKEEWQKTNKNSTCTPAGSICRIWAGGSGVMLCVLFYTSIFWSMFYWSTFMAHSDGFAWRHFHGGVPFPLTTPDLPFPPSPTISVLSSSLISGGICGVSWIGGSYHLQIGTILQLLSHSCPFISFSCLTALAKGFKHCVEYA